MSFNANFGLRGWLRKQQRKLPKKQQYEKAIQQLQEIAQSFIPEAVYQTDLDKLKLPVFIDCMVSEQYAGLLVSGPLNIGEALAAWQKVYTEYAERVGGISVSAILRRETEIIQICSRYDRVMMIVFIARSLFTCSELADIFKAEGFTFDPNAEDEVRERQLKVIEAKLKPDLLRLNKLATAKEQQEKSTKHQKQSWKDFNELLARMSSAEQFQLRADNLTVGEFCAYLVRHRERVEKSHRPTFQAR